MPPVPPKPPIAQIESSSLLLVRPHAVKAGMVGRMIDQVAVAATSAEVVASADRKSVV